MIMANHFKNIKSGFKENTVFRILQKKMSHPEITIYKKMSFQNGHIFNIKSCSYKLLSKWV